MFRKLGYTQDIKEMLADEAEWFVAVDRAISEAQKVMERVRGKK